MIHNMVLERYPRDEDEKYDDVASPIKEPSASHDPIVFGSFESPITPISNPLIEPEFDGLSIKIGEISCVLITSSNNIVYDDDFVFAMHKDEKLQFLEPNMKIRNYVFNVSEASEKFVIHTLVVRPFVIHRNNTLYSHSTIIPCFSSFMTNQ